MTGTLIATTKNADFHALAYKGILAWDRYPQLQNILEGPEFGEEYKLLFARPIENRLASEMDWYTEAGEAKSVADLPEEKKTETLSKVQQMAAAIEIFAEQLCSSKEPLKATRGHLLKLALLYPDDRYIYLAGSQPVIVCWGFGPGTPGVEPKNLVRLAGPALGAVPTGEPRQDQPEEESQEEPMESAAPQPKEEETRKSVSTWPVFAWTWLWWLLPLAALLLLLYLLFTSFGSLPPLGGWRLFNGPELPFKKNITDRSGEIAALENEIDGLRDRAMRHAEQCRKENAAPPSGEELVIPDRAEDASFLAGEWLCRTGLANARTREPVEFAFQFGTNGSGKAIVYEKDDRCTGDARASLENGELRIIVAPQHCAKSGTAYSEISIICTGAGRATRCAGTHKGGGSWDANFEKIR